MSEWVGFTALPAALLAVLAVMIPIYLALVELGKRRFYRVQPRGPVIARPRPERERRIHHRASRWTTHGGPHRPITAHR